jgi:hypothetical protein
MASMKNSGASLGFVGACVTVALWVYVTQTVPRLFGGNSTLITQVNDRTLVRVGASSTEFGNKGLDHDEDIAKSSSNATLNETFDDEVKRVMDNQVKQFKFIISPSKTQRRVASILYQKARRRRSFTRPDASYLV